MSLVLLGGASAAAGGYPSVVLADGPVGYWRFGEAVGTVAADETGRNPGVYRGAVALGLLGVVAGDPDTAAGFDSADEGVDLGDGAGLDFGISDFAVEAWVKTTVNGEQVFVGKDGYIGEPAWQLTVTDDSAFTGRPRVKVFDGVSDHYAYGGARIDDGGWHHVVAEFDRDNSVTIYVDARPATTALPTPRPFESFGRLEIGRARDSHYPDFRGTIDEVALYPRVLGRTTVEAHFGAATTVADGAGPVITLVTPANGSRTNQSRPTFAGQAGTSADDLRTVTVKLYPGGDASGTPLAFLTGAVAPDGSYAVTPAVPLADGTYAARSEQSDEAGNVGRSTSSSFVVDTAAPAVTITSPPDGSRTSDRAPAFRGRAGISEGDRPTITVSVYAGASVFGPLVQVLAAAAGVDGTYVAPRPLPLPDGTYTAHAEQEDAAGNRGTSAATTFVVDTAAPAVTLGSPANGSTTGPAPMFQGRAGILEGDAPTVTVQLYAGDQAGGTPITSRTTTRAADGSYSVSVSDALFTGTYTARAEQTDTAGNTGMSAPTTFQVSALPAYALPAYAAEVLADGPVGYWRLGETAGTIAADETGRNPGAYRGAIALGLPGAVAGDPNTAAGFDGVDEGVDLGDGPGLDVGLSDFAVEAWVKTTANGEEAIIGKDGEPSWQLTVTNDATLEGRPRMMVSDGVSTFYAYGPARIDDGSWHHVVADVDRYGGITVYVDAAPVATMFPTPRPFESTAGLEIARDSHYPDFRGTIDEVALYPKLLGSTRVAAHYRVQQPPQPPPPPAPAPSLPAVVWSADMETGDLSQWSRDGTRGGSYDSGACLRPPNGVSSDVVHSGRYSMKMTIDLGLGEAGCRQFRHQESLTGAAFYYGAWYYLPAYVAGRDYWNVFQFKSETATLNDPFWALDLMPRVDGALRLRLRWKGTVVGPYASSTTTGTRHYDQSTLTVPVARWFHVEAYLKQASDFTGRLTIWQDGVQLYDMVDVKTKYPGGDQRWSVNNYSNGLLPSLATLYVDDATVATQRVGGP